jgi:MOSC domain-containing protein YiiM
MGYAMQLISVNVGAWRTQQKGTELEITGIYKQPTRETVEITPLGIEADFIGDAANHGGPDQAIYIYGATDYVWWSKALHQELAPGTFGDNLTISDLESARFTIGDRLRIGTVVLEVAAPRIPCSTLARRMADPMFVKKYHRAERPGLYCRVLQPGSLKADDIVLREPYAGDAVGVLEVFREHLHRHKEEAALRRFLRVPIATRERAAIERDLRNLNGPG